jgi:hypothetical protein
VCLKRHGVGVCGEPGEYSAGLSHYTTPTLLLGLLLSEQEPMVRGVELCPPSMHLVVYLMVFVPGLLICTPELVVLLMG